MFVLISLARSEQLMASTPDRSDPDFAPDIAPLSPGSAFGNYRIEGILGRGGMGVVYRAEQLNLERDVALKIVRADLSTPHVLKRFEFEAEVLGRLQHPGIAHIYEAGTVDLQGIPTPFMAMELVEGRPIDQASKGRPAAAWCIATSSPPTSSSRPRAP